MARDYNLTSIAVSREHYKILQEMGKKNETFDQIIGKLLKNAKAQSE